MGIGTMIHEGTAIFGLATGNIPLAITETTKAVKSYTIGQALSPITDVAKDYFSEGVEATCDPDVVDSIPWL